MAFMLPEILTVDRLEDAVVVEESKGTVLLILACCVDPGPRTRGKCESLRPFQSTNIPFSSLIYSRSFSALSLFLFAHKHSKRALL